MLLSAGLQLPSSHVTTRPNPIQSNPIQSFNRTLNTTCINTSSMQSIFTYFGCNKHFQTAFNTLITQKFRQNKETKEYTNRWLIGCLTNVETERFIIYINIRPRKHTHTHITNRRKISVCFFHFLKNELKINRILIPFTRYFIIIDDIQYSQENSKLFGNYLIEANEFDQFDV